MGGSYRRLISEKRKMRSNTGDDSMDYVKQIEAFYDWLETNSISTSCIALWHALMAINKKAGWIPEFAVSITTLEAKTGIKKRTIENARNTLQQKELITWKSRSGNQSAVYSIKNLYANNDLQNGLYAINTPQSGSQYGAQSGSQPCAINIQQQHQQQTREDEKRIDTDISPIGIFFEQNGFGTVSSFIRDEINYWIDGDFFDDPVDVIVEALKESVSSNVRTWNYANRILISWSDRKLRNLNLIKAHQIEFRNRKQQRNRVIELPVKNEPEVDPYLKKYGFR